MKTKPILYCLAIWVTYGLCLYLLQQNQFELGEVTSISGISISGVCGKTGQRETVEFVAVYDGDGHRVKDVIWLEPGQKCDLEILRRFSMTKITKTVFRNANLGLEADGFVIRDSASGIKEFADFRSSYVLITLLAIAFSVGVYFAYRERG